MTGEFKEKPARHYSPADNLYDRRRQRADKRLTICILFLLFVITGMITFFAKVYNDQNNKIAAEQENKSQLVANNSSLQQRLELQYAQTWDFNIEAFSEKIKLSENLQDYTIDNFTVYNSDDNQETLITAKISGHKTNATTSSKNKTTTSEQEQSLSIYFYRSGDGSWKYLGDQGDNICNLEATKTFVEKLNCESD